MTTYNAELPGVYVDGLVVGNATAFDVANRYPEPDDVEVPIDTDIDVSIFNPTNAITSLGPSKVYVNGVLAFDGAATTKFSPGFDGPNSIFGTVATGMFRVFLDRTGVFASQQVVTVRAVGADTTGAYTVDKSWTFTCQDLTAPAVVAAQAVDHETVRVTFSEPMSDASLDPTFYVIVPLAAPSVVPAVTKATRLSSSTVELETDIRMSQGVPYRVVVIGASDIHGNAVAMPANTADFVATSCLVPAGRKFNLYRMLPKKNRREDETGDLEKFTACLQEVTNLMLCEIDRFADELDPDTASEGVVDLMLLDLGNPFAFDLTLDDKRRLLRILVPLYKQAGTAPGIKNAVRFFLGFEIDLVPYLGEGLVLGESALGVDWTLGPSSARMKRSFDVVVARILTAEERSRLVSLVRYMKPLNTHLVNVIEPIPPVVVDHLELGMSELGDQFILHGTLTTVPVVPPAPILSALSYAVTDVGGGDTLPTVGSSLDTLTGVQFSRDGGVTWAAGALGALTSTTAQLIPPAMAAYASGLVRVVGPGGNSNALALEFWSPAQITGVTNYGDARKGVSTNDSAIVSVTDQVSAELWSPFTAGGGDTPTLAANAFGAKPGFRMAPASGAVGAQLLRTPSGTRKVQGSVFAAVKYTDTDATVDGYPGNAPLTLFGDLSGSVNMQFGAAAGALRTTTYVTGVGWTMTDRASGLNDGAARMVGTTFDLATNTHSTYVGATLSGSTFVAAPSGGPGVNAVGGGYSQGDGFRGDVAFWVICSGVISASDLAKLHTWAQAGFGAAA